MLTMEIKKKSYTSSRRFKEYYFIPGDVAIMLGSGFLIKVKTNRVLKIIVLEYE